MEWDCSVGSFWSGREVAWLIDGRLLGVELRKMWIRRCGISSIGAECGFGLL